MYDMAVSININSICCPKEIEKSTEQIDKQSSDPFFCYLVKYVNSNQTREIVCFYLFIFFTEDSKMCFCSLVCPESKFNPL